jgi:DNA-directed RNA polymerase specialized sigma24 family protein/CheY-like chemotaxis protein
MSLSETIARDIPYLRRFARALVGSQNGGDAYAAATLEAIVADPKSFDISLSPRVSLYRLFLRIWGSVSLNSFADKTSPSPVMGVADRNLEAITPRPRVAFLLSALEEFAPDQIAVALDCELSEVSALLDEAAREIALQIATDILIIEDEPMIAMDLEALVLDQGHSVIGIARTHDEAIDIVRDRKPGLVLADLRLADGSSGLKAVNDILAGTSVPVIFITAYPEEVLTGAAPEPTFLITKPFRRDTVKAAIAQALFFQRNARLAG